MPSDLLIAVMGGLSAMFGWGFADFFAKKTIDKVGDLVSLSWGHIFGVVVISLLILGRTIQDGSLYGLPSTTSETLKLAFFGALQALVYFFVYRAFSKGKLSLLNPVFSSFPAFVVIISIVFFGEIVGLPTLLVLAVIFLGIMLINVDEASLEVRKLRLSKIAGMKDMLAAVVLATIWTAAWGRFVLGKDWLVYAGILYIFMSITILIITAASKVSLRIKDNKIWKYFFLIGFSEVVAYVGISIGYSLTPHLSIVAVLSGAFSLPTIILAHLFLKERITKLQLCGVLAVIIGVVLISLV